MNECASHTPEGEVKYKTQLEQFRLLDPTRPVTFASCQFQDECCFQYADIVSINIYAGWYEEDEISQLYANIIGYARENGGAGKPVIISEFGAGGIYGERNIDRPKWSEEGQCDILQENLAFYLSRPEIVGVTVWQFCDCRVCEDGWFLRRPGTKNNKGILDRYRRPKLAFETVRQAYQRAGVSVTQND